MGTGGGRDLRRTDKRRNGSNTQGSNTGGGRDLKKGPNDNRKDSYTESPKNRSENAYDVRGGDRRLSREVEGEMNDHCERDRETGDCIEDNEGDRRLVREIHGQANSQDYEWDKEDVNEE